MKPVELHREVQAIHRATEKLLIALETEMSETELSDRAAQEHADAVEQAKRELQAERVKIPVVEIAQPMVDKPIEVPFSGPFETTPSDELVAEQKASQENQRKILEARQAAAKLKEK